MSLQRVEFIGNTAEAAGGGLYLGQDAQASLNMADFIGNYAEGRSNSGPNDGLGGALFLEAGSSIELTEARFYDNHADSGGALYLAGSGTKATVNGASFTGGHAAGQGGAVYVGAGAYADLTEVDFTGNYAFEYGGAIHNAGLLRLTDANFTANVAEELNGGAIYNDADAKIALKVTAGQTALFSGNAQKVLASANPGGPEANSIYFARGSSLEVTAAKGALLDMRDAMAGHSEGGQTTVILKRGSGRWRLAGDNNFTADSNTLSGTAFEIVEGTLALADGTSLDLAGDSSRFTLNDGARLDVGRGVNIAAADITLADGAILGFDVGTQTDNKQALLTLTAAGGATLGTGGLGVDLLSSPMYKGQEYLLAAGANFGAVGNYTLTVLGQSLAGTRGENAYELLTDTNNLKVKQTDDISNYVLTWTNGGHTGQWNTSDQNWQRSGQSTERYYVGDGVIFTANQAGTVDIHSGGASVASMAVTGGDYIFTGGNLTGAGSGTRLDPSQHYGQLAISGGGAEFRNQAAFAGGASVTNGYLKLASGGQLNADTTVGRNGRLHLTSGSHLFGQTSVADQGRVSLAGTANLTGNLNVAGGGIYELGAGGTITGDLSLASGSVLDIIGRDQLTVTGAADLNSGLNAHLTYAQWLGGEVVTLMQAGSLTGSFNEQDLSTAAFAGRLYADSSDQSLKLEVLESLDLTQTIQGSFNQMSTVSGVLSLPDNNPVKDLLVLGAIEETERALDLVSGEGQVSTAGAILNRVRTQGFQAGSRLADLYRPNFDWAPSAGSSEDRPTSVWVSLGGGRAAIDGNSNSAKTKLTGPEAAIGLDGRLGDGWLTGVSFNYAGLESKVDSRRYEADIDAYGLTAYFGREIEIESGRWRFLAGGGYTRYDIDSKRTAAFTGFHEQLKADYSADSLMFFGEAAFAFPVSCAVALEPYLNLSWSRLEVDGWREKGGFAALRGRSETYDGVTSLLGLRTYASLSDRVDLRLNLGWQHAFGDIDSEGIHQFRDGSDQFRVQGVSASRNSALAGLGLEVNLTDGLDLTVGYDGLFGNDSQSHSGTASLMWSW